MLLVMNWLDEVQTAPPVGYVWCGECDGSGDCPSLLCLKTGYKADGRECSDCQGSGLCLSCKGNGHIKPTAKP